MKRVIVCGAGWAGLNAARRLVADGFEVKVLEKSDGAGGRIRTDIVDGFTLDHGFQVINPGYSELRETGVLKKVRMAPLPKGLEIRRGMETLMVGDFRTNFRYLKDDLSNKSGTLKEKIHFLNYLRSRAADTNFGDAMLELGSLYEEILKPFLTGVFLCNPDQVSNRMARELIHWFIKGAPGIPVGGVNALSSALADGLDIEYQVDVLSASATSVSTRSGQYQADAVVLALDPITSAQLLNLPAPRMNPCITWYLAAPKGVVTSRHLRAGGVGPIVNTVALSNIEPGYAPADATLIVATALTPTSESEIRNQLSYLWEVDVRDWQLIRKYEIANALPFHPAGKELVSQVRHDSGVYLTGDWRNIPAQQGALLSGRLAADAIRADLAER